MGSKISMNQQLAGGINALCLSEGKADVHFKLPYCLKNPNETKVWNIIRYNLEL
jgi:hypothetical protein